MILRYCPSFGLQYHALLTTNFVIFSSPTPAAFELVKNLERTKREVHFDEPMIGPQDGPIEGSFSDYVCFG